MTRYFWLLLAGLLLVPISVSAQDFGSALRFDGIDDSLQVPVFPAITGPFTVEAWIKPGPGGGGINPRIVELVGSEDTSFRLMLGGDTAGLTERPVELGLHFIGGFQRIGSDCSVFGSLNVTCPTPILLQLNTWYHVAGVFTGTMQEIYIDGVRVAYTEAGGTLKTNTFLGIGTAMGLPQTNIKDTFEGLIDEVRIWNYGRTELEIKAAMDTELVGNEAGLLGYWNLNDGSGQTAADSTTNGNDASLGSPPNDPAWDPPTPGFECQGFDSPLNAGPVTLSKKRVLLFDAGLVDRDEVEITDADIAAPPVLQVTFSSVTPTDPTTDITNDVPRSQKRLPSSNQFEYSEQTNGWRTSIKTEFYQAPGSYLLQMVSGDATEYVIEPACETIYVVQ
jgi:hypothetical protein